jgi:hypothetical protein
VNLAGDDHLENDNITAEEVDKMDHSGRSQAIETARKDAVKQ